VTQALSSLAQVAARYDAIVFDQWGVLHNGSAPYAGVVACLDGLRAQGRRMAVLSNSGKRAAPNAARIAAMGIGAPFETVMTSGEALWREISAGHLPNARLYPIERATGDAAAWAKGLDLTLTTELDTAAGILLMGLPDGSKLADWHAFLTRAFTLALPVYCTNPDRKSPRAGALVTSPGAVAFAYAERGGAVRFYGKPHRPVFDALETALGTSKLLMVGDSLEHDIAGAQAAGWDTVLIQGGLYADAFAAGNPEDTLTALVADYGCRPPTYRMDLLA